MYFKIISEICCQIFTRRFKKCNESKIKKQYSYTLEIIFQVFFFLNVIVSAIEEPLRKAF